MGTESCHSEIIEFLCPGSFQWDEMSRVSWVSGVREMHIFYGGSRVWTLEGVYKFLPLKNWKSRFLPNDFVTDNRLQELYSVCIICNKIVWQSGRYTPFLTSITDITCIQSPYIPLCFHKILWVGHHLDSIHNAALASSPFSTNIEYLHWMVCGCGLDLQANNQHSQVIKQKSSRSPETNMGTNRIMKHSLWKDWEPTKTLFFMWCWSSMSNSWYYLIINLNPMIEGNIENSELQCSRNSSKNRPVMYIFYF